MNSAIQIENATLISSIDLKTQRIINELIAVNNDRIEGYQVAANQINESYLKNLCTRLSEQSEQFNMDLKILVPFKNANELPAISDTLYRACIYVKGAALVNDNKRILLACSVGERMALKTYKEALTHKLLPSYINNKLEEHILQLTKVLSEIKSLSKV